MPELPEVETIRRDILRETKGLLIEEVRVLDGRVVRGLPPDEFARRLTGQRIHDVQRRGKAILIDLGELFLIVQPMMTGQLIASSCRSAHQDESQGLAKETRVVFKLSKRKTLVYNDQRLFGRLTLVGHPHDHAHIRALGPEPLDADFTVDVLRERLRGRQSAIKVVLLDGKCIAGIGNIYASEILFRAGILPTRKASALKSSSIERLWRAIRSVLAEAVRLRGTSMRNYRDGRGAEGKYLKIIKVYGRDDESCRTCGGPVKRIVQAQRSTFYCPKCQK